MSQQKRNLFTRCFPHPFIAFLVAFAWIILAGSYSVQSFVMAGLLALIIPHLTHPFMAKAPKIRWLLAIKLIFIVLWDIIVSNFKVAKIVLGSMDNLQPKWFRVPLECDHELVNALLAMIITTTPGTVSAGIDQEKHDILVHALSSDDEQADIADMKQRYEALLIQIFNVDTGASS